MLLLAAACAGRPSTRRGLASSFNAEVALSAACALFALAVSLWTGCYARIMATNDSLAALATHALGFVKAGDVVGLGSGRAAEAFVHDTECCRPPG